MPMTSPDRIELTDNQRGDLNRLVRAGRAERSGPASCAGGGGRTPKRPDRGIVGYL